MNEQKNKKRKLVIAIIALIVIFLICSVFIKSTPKGRENKIISLLENKYKTDFEIIGLVDEGEKIIVNGLRCDGSTIIPEIKDKGTYNYIYEVRATEDNILFFVEYSDKKIIDTITDSYFREKYGNELVINIANYIVDEIGDETSVVEYETNKEGLFGMSGIIQIKINQDLDNVINRQFIEKKLRKISSYIKEQVKKEKNVSISTYVNYNNNMQLHFYNKNSLPIVRKLAGKDVEDSYVYGGIELESYTPYEYLERAEE